MILIIAWVTGRKWRRWRHLSSFWDYYWKFLVFVVGASIFFGAHSLCKKKRRRRKKGLLSGTYSSIGGRRTWSRRTARLEFPGNLRTSQAGILELRTILKITVNNSHATHRTQSTSSSSTCRRKENKRFWKRLSPHVPRAACTRLLHARIPYTCMVAHSYDRTHLTIPRLSLKLVVEHKIWDRASQIFASRWSWK